MPRFRMVLAASLAALSVTAVAEARTAPVPPDPSPVVLTGAQTPRLLKAAPGRIVAFRFAHAWRQIPVQVDERAMVNLAQIYHDTVGGVAPQLYKNAPTIDAYTDPTTWTGPDPDPAFDGGDEIAFMARDVGRRAPRGAPRGVVSASRTVVRVGAGGYAYLFRVKPGSNLKPAAGKRYVQYRFALISGAYRSTYRLGNGPNPEASVASSRNWSAAFTDRWTFEDLRMHAGRASGADILDRATSQFSPSACGRSEQTFRTGEGAFIANKAGPVRAIRSFIGANSGPFTQRDMVMYDGRIDIRTDLRVHPIPSVMDLLDYSHAAIGMTYRNTLNPAGATVDGRPDALTAGFSPWEQVSGPQGTLTSVELPPANLAALRLRVSTYQLDQLTPASTQLLLCTGDQDALGVSGSFITGSIPNTDPARGPAQAFHAERIMFADPPGLGAATAARHARQVTSPPRVRVAR